MYWSVLITDNDNIYSSKIRLGCKKQQQQNTNKKNTFRFFSYGPGSIFKKIQMFVDKTTLILDIFE